MKKTNRLVALSLLTAIALIIYSIELQLPPLTSLPGVKLGLANMVSLTALILFGKKEALTILLLRIILGSLLTGQMSAIFFSLAGGLLSNLAMIILYSFFKDRIHLCILSIIGSILHTVGQLCVAALIIENLKIYFYLPFLVISSIITGYFIGLATHFISLHLKKLLNI